MRQEKLARSHRQLPHQNCPKCGAPMWLARIAPDKPDHDERTFECAECNHSVTEVVTCR